ncbi:hypothetical protein RIF29_41290 [Crotalaria pallida]|uniref:Uncharacterized protein n=1 Tax=Crotalaria pallida TaxID=3830 RepID=A0AAN9HSJ0_CROPI
MGEQNAAAAAFAAVFAAAECVDKETRGGRESVHDHHSRPVHDPSLYAYLDRGEIERSRERERVSEGRLGHKCLPCWWLLRPWGGGWLRCGGGCCDLGVGREGRRTAWLLLVVVVVVAAGLVAAAVIMRWLLLLLAFLQMVALKDGERPSGTATNGEREWGAAAGEREWGAAELIKKEKGEE